MNVTNPATEEIRQIVETPLQEIPSIVAESRSAAPAWRAVDVKKRAQIVAQIAPILVANADTLANLITLDMGKPLRFAKKEVLSMADKVQYLCEQAPGWLGDEPCGEGIIRFDPLGVFAVISPWNYPVYTALTGVVHALLAGNTVIFKPSEYTLSTGIELNKLIRGILELAGGVFLSVIGGKEHGKALLQQKVEGVFFTGSTAVGKVIAQEGASTLRRHILELGGMDAAIVLADADIEKSAHEIVRTNARNSGQICCSIKRVYVEDSVYEAFVKAAVVASNQVTYGPPEGEFDMGPLVGEFQLAKIEAIVDDARKKGAQFLTGGQRPASRGYFYPSTVITGATQEMRLLTEEPFGPLLPIMPISSLSEGITRANDSCYGLTASVWTTNKERGREIAAQLDVGNVTINGHAAGGLGCPWGGAKESGVGRTNTKEGQRQFTNAKYIQEIF